jgi:hypothetical protein
MRIEVTPEMIKAGKRSISGGDTMSEGQMCAIIYRAMEIERRRQIGDEPPTPVGAQPVHCAGKPQ